MKIVGIGEFPAHFFGEQFSNCSLARAGRSHQDHDHDSMRLRLGPPKELVQE